MRRLALLAVAALFVAGCGAGRQAAPPTPTTRKPPPAPSHPAAHVPRVQVTIVDGDTNRPVPGVRVTVGDHSARSNWLGVAKVPLRRRTTTVTTASKPGYIARAVRVPFRTRPKSTLRIFRRSLQWTVYGVDAGRTQSQPAMSVRPPFRVVWSRGLGSLVEFPAVVTSGVAYVGNAHGIVRALDMADGALIWKHVTPNGKMASSPAIFGGLLVVHGMDGRVWILRRADGKALWHYTVGSPVESSPILVDGLDVFGAWNGTITALDLHTHRVRWRRYDGCKITSSASYADGTIYIGDYCGRLLALDPRTGALRWSRSVNGRIYGTPAVSGGRVFVPSSTGDSLTAFTTGGAYLWSRGTGSYVYSSPAVSDGRVFFGSYNGVFYALRASDGATIWTQDVGGPISGAATVVAGVAYAGSFSHRIVGVDVASGRVVLDFPHGEYVPVSGGGRRLLLNGYSRIYAVEHR